jgi:hypothetical protein
MANNVMRDTFTREYCLSEIGRIRKTISDKFADSDTWDACFTALAFMLANCSEDDVADIIRCQIAECQIRHGYLTSATRGEEWTK